MPFICMYVLIVPQQKHNFYIADPVMNGLDDICIYILAKDILSYTKWQSCKKSIL
jgi:hypothetical protein